MRSRKQQVGKFTKREMRVISFKDQLDPNYVDNNVLFSVGPWQGPESTEIQFIQTVADLQPKPSCSGP